MANDSEATRAVGMTSEQKVRAAIPSAVQDGYGTYIWHDDARGNHVVLADNWDNALIDPAVISYEAQHRPVREGLGDMHRRIMRDTTDAVSGEKPKCDFWRHKNQVCDICQRVSPLIVTRNGVPCADQKAALAEFVERCAHKPVAPDICKDAVHSIECKSEKGILIGLLDSIMTIATVAWDRIQKIDPDDTPQAVLEAFTDLFESQDLRYLLSIGGNRTYEDEPNEFRKLMRGIYDDLGAGPIIKSLHSDAAIRSELSPKQGEPKVCVDCRDYEQNIRSWIEELGGDASSEHISLTLESLLRSSNAEVGRLKNCGMIELMLANPNADSFVRDKETEVGRLREELKAANEYHEGYVAERKATLEELFAAGQQKGREECLEAVRSVDETGAEGLAWKEDFITAILALPKVGE